MSASSLLVLVLWSTALLSEKGRLLAVVNAEAISQLPDCTATADGGRCDRIDDERGCPRVREGAKECAQRTIELQEHNSSCDCSLPSSPSFCDGEQARNINASDFPVNITYTVPNHKQFTVTASVKNLQGTWNYVMVITNRQATMTVGNRCTCGSTQNQQVSVNRTAYFKNNVEHGSLHLCLRSSSEPRTLHLVHNFSIGSECLEFVNYHHLPAHRCNQPIDIGRVGRVRDLTVRQTSVPSMLQVSWRTPGVVDFLNLHGETYYLTLNSTPGVHHTFSVSNSTNVTCTVRPGVNYTVTVRTWIWCETTSCEEQASVSAFLPPLSTPTLPTTSHTQPATSTTEGRGGPTANRYSNNVMPMVIIGFSSTAVLIFLFIIVATMVYCKCRKKERYRYSQDDRCCAESRARIPNSCSTDSESTTPNVDTTSSISDKISDIESDNHTDRPTASNRLVPISTAGSQSIRMQEYARLVADHHTDSTQVLIVGSQRVSTVEHVQRVAVPLLAYDDIDILMYGVGTDATEQNHQRLPPSMWVQQAMDQAEFVLCICNKEFMEDWCYNGHEMCHDVSLVRSVSQHVAGQMNHGQSSAVQRKFVAIVHCEEDLRYIPAGLKDCNVFVLNCDANIERLAKYLVQIPTVRIDHISSRL